MDKKNLERRNFLKVAASAILLSACAPSNLIIEEDSKPVKTDFNVTSENHFRIFDRKGKETGMYLEERFYDKISGKKGELVEIPNLEGLYVKAGQGRWDAIRNNLSNGGGYMPVYSDGKPVRGVYTSELEVKNLCYKSGGEQSFDGRLVKIPGTSLETQCVQFDEVNPVQHRGAGGDGGSGGSGSGGSGSGGGGGGSSGGDSGGGR